MISINPLIIPYSFIKNTDNKVALEFSDTKCLDVENETKKSDTYQCSEAVCQKTMPSMPKNNAYNNKNIIIKISNKNIDANIDKNLDEKNEALDTLEKNNQIKPQTLLQTSNSQHLESELYSLSSKSLKNIVKDFMDALPLTYNSIIEDVPRIINENLSKKNKINIKNNFDILTSTKTSSQPKASNDRQHKDFRYFYPISEKDSNMLNFKANREFDTNFTNQLLLKLYIKYPEKRFKNRFTFSDYMVKALRDENHQGPLVNHPTFRFSCNIGKEEKNLLEYEKYLSQIENSFDTSKEMCVKKKIAGRFSSEVAYKILTKVEFKLNPDNSFITALIPSSLALSERQIEILSDQLEAVYGINRYYIQELEAAEKLLTPEFKTENTNSIKTSISVAEPSNGKETTEEHAV